MRPVPLLLCLLLLASGLAPCARAQPVSAQSTNAPPTNVELLQAIAVDCLAELPDSVRAFRLEAPATSPYVRTALVQRWQAEGRTIFLPEAPSGPDDDPAAARARSSYARLTYDLEHVDVRYERGPGRQLRRSVSLALRYRLADSDGRLLAERRCADTRTDLLPRRAAAAVEAPEFPETTAEMPPSGWLRRYLEPALLTAATAVGVYLFFVLRSDAVDS